MNLAETVSRSIEELKGVADALSSTEMTSLSREMAEARRIALYGVGREGLVMRGLAMRLYHLGLDAHVVGSMDCPPIGKGDSLIVSAGPGSFFTVLALMNVASNAGARTVVFTAEPSGAAARLADAVFKVPAQTMASDRAARESLLPMGSLYELSLWLYCDLFVLALQERLGVSYDKMRSRHTNLE